MVVVVWVAVVLGGFEPVGFMVLQLVDSKQTRTINMIFFNIFSTLRILAWTNIAKLLPNEDSVGCGNNVIFCERSMWAFVS